jgi:hypothetical protein
MSHAVQKQAVPAALGRRAGGPLWIAATAALACAALAVVLLLAGGGNEPGAPAEPGRAAATPNGADGIRYDGGPDEGTRGVVPAQTAKTAPGIRYDGGPDEGTRDSVPAETLGTAPGVRYDRGPEEGTADVTAPAAKDGSQLRGPGLSTN